jgi:hypothetical protein
MVTISVVTDGKVKTIAVVTERKVKDRMDLTKGHAFTIDMVSPAATTFTLVSSNISKELSGFRLLHGNTTSKELLGLRLECPNTTSKKLHGFPLAYHYTTGLHGFLTRPEGTRLMATKSLHITQMSAKGWCNCQST